LTGFLLGDGWLEKHGQGARLAISLITKYADVAQWYLVLLFGMGYTHRLQLGAPLHRVKKKRSTVSSIAYLYLRVIVTFIQRVVL
jgi:hypothetical protein